MSYFITGTDTDAGKTVFATALLDWLSKQTSSAVGYKPIAAGCEQANGRLQNTDALALLAASQPKPLYQAVNPIALEEAIAPHIAAENSGIGIELADLEAGYHKLQSQYQHVVVEGAGGWLVPINASQSLADLAAAIHLPVILVVGMKLGCINHALLTAAAIQQSQCKLAGWVANTLEPQMPALEQNIQHLTSTLNAPLLGIVPHLDNPDTESVQRYIDFSQLDD